MDKVPEKGRRIRYTPPADVDWRTPVSGVCLGHYKKVDFDDEDFDWENDEGMPPIRGNRPEREWAVRMQVDRPLPDWWAYGQECDVFCPAVGEVEYE